MKGKSENLEKIQSWMIFHDGLGFLGFGMRFKGLGNLEMGYMRCVCGFWDWIEAEMGFGVLRQDYRPIS